MKRRLWSGRLRLPAQASIAILAMLGVCWAAQLCYVDSTSNYIISATQQSAAGSAGVFSNTSAANTNDAVSISHSGSGGSAIHARVATIGPIAGLFENTAAQGTPPAPAIKATNQNGDGVYGWSHATYGGNFAGDSGALLATCSGGATSVAITATAGGLASAGSFSIMSSNTNTALQASHSGGGAALSAVNNGTGRAATFDITGNTNMNPALWAHTANLSSSAYAGYFYGNMNITGVLTVCGSKCFKLDHPLDPEHKYLVHSCVESNERLDSYSGNATTDSSGSAVVSLPTYYDALNRDTRYQLTVIGSPARAWVSVEESNNSFSIKSDAPATKVSWRVEGVRQDVWANAHPMQVEVPKPANEVGTYLDAADWGQPMSKSLDYQMEQRATPGAPAPVPQAAARRAPSASVMSGPSRSPVGRRVVAPR